MPTDYVVRDALKGVIIIIVVIIIIIIASTSGLLKISSWIL